MKRVDRLPLRQRLVLVIAIGAVLLVVGGWITDRGRSGGGWFGYAPNTPIVGYARDAMRPGAAALVRLAMIVVWAAVSLRLLRCAGRDRLSENPSSQETPSDG